MTRSELIVEIMAQVYEVTDESDSSLRRNVEYRLRLIDTRVLRDIYACNSVQEAVRQAKAAVRHTIEFPRSNPSLQGGEAAPAAGAEAHSRRRRHEFEEWT